MRQIIVGDHAGLVDQLVESCEIKAPASSSYTGYGRDLVPFFDMHEPVGNPNMMAPLEEKRGCQRGSPRKAPGNRTNGNRAGSPGQRASAMDRQTPSPKRHSPRKSGKLTVELQQPAYCTPGFSQSPKPEAIPLPTFGLLQRAVAKGFTCKSAVFQAPPAAIATLSVAA